MAEYITKEQVLEWFRPYGHTDEPIPFETLAADLRDCIPAADVAPIIHGTWNLLRHDKFSDVFQCSECGRKVSLTHGRDVLEQFPYCHCGAKMEGAPCQEHQP